MVFGTFDILHPGHLNFFKKARKYGTELSVVIARDKTVKHIKGRFPKNREQKRKKNLLKMPYVDKVHLGFLRDKYRIIEKIKPHYIVLGYDQEPFTDNLRQELRRRRLRARIIRLERPYKHHRYKSSLLR